MGGWTRRPGSHIFRSNAPWRWLSPMACRLDRSTPRQVRHAP